MRHRKSRRDAREIALKTLYQIAVAHVDQADALSAAVDDTDPERREAGNWDQQLAYARRVIQGVLKGSDDFDAIIARYARDWDPDRMPTVDHILAHIALYELIHETETPYRAVIDEAVELAKKFSTDESSGFINGVLGSWVRAEGPEAPGHEKGE